VAAMMMATSNPMLMMMVNVNANANGVKIAMLVDVRPHTKTNKVT
jgi:hypothetical protein